MELDNGDVDYTLYGDQESEMNELKSLIERYKTSTCDDDKGKIETEIIEKFGFKIN